MMMSDIECFHFS